MGIERKSTYTAIREFGPLLNESEHIYGRDKEKEEIVEILVNQVTDCEQLSVLPIIGIGGLGKTTLARLVFNDKKVDEHFDVKIWVDVPQNFDFKILMKAMIESATGKGSSSDLAYLPALQRRLWELLNQKRYLLVLDDVWNEDQEQWCKLKNAVTCGSKGATIVLTTRTKKVADITGTLPAHHLAGLSQENCWLLFKERAFGKGKEEHPKLEPIGKQIVNKCGGVPLAAKALGGLLRFKRTEKEWLHVRDSEIWNLPQETLILPALLLSYHHLPLELRGCFAYCAVFPKDSEIHKEELIFLWMAHGYISSIGKLEEEDIGNGIWNELVLRSLFQDVRKDHRGRTTFRMHDLVHDLAQSIVENKVTGIQGNDKSASKGKIRQVNLRKHLVAFPSNIRVDIDLSFCLTNFNSLRTLDASSLPRIHNIPSTIGNLKHLRYLNLSYTPIRTLPNVICRLWNLKILNLNSCEDLVGLPKQMKLLRNLRHLLLEDCNSLNEMPSKIGELSSLKTLSLFVVGPGKGSLLGELQFLNIGGKLTIRHLQRVENNMDAKMANLHENENLRELRLEWKWECNTSEREEISMDENVLEALQPHPNIKVINIHGFGGRYFPRWLRNSSLVNLVKFYLENCPNCLCLPQLSELAHLKIMEIRYVDVEYVVEDDIEYGSSKMTKFPSLEELKLDNLPLLKAFSKEMVTEIFPRLQRLSIKQCPSLILPPLPALEHLYVGENSKEICSFFMEGFPPRRIYVGDVGDVRNELPENLTNLRSLWISCAHENTVSARGLRGLQSLESLRIWSCNWLTCLPYGWSPHLTTLKDLTIAHCPEFVELPEDIRYLKSLTSLSLHDLPKMVSLPEALKHLSSPYSLYLGGLPELTTAPDCLRSFTSLISLSISRCPKVTSLPDSIKELENLKYFEILSCPELERRCQKGVGEDWQKIAHIPRVRINWKICQEQD